jgi:hypothetical protein
MVTMSREYHQAYYKKNKKKINKQSKQYRENRKINDREGYMLTQLRNHAKDRRKEFNLTIEDIVIPDICPILHIPIDRTAKGPHPNSPAIDRIDNSKGYLKGNVCIISAKANMLKSNLTIIQLERLLNYMRKGL